MDYIVYPGSPITLSWSLYIREPYVLVERHVLPAIPEYKAKRVRPIGEGRPFGPFRLHPGRYVLDPEINAEKVLRKGLPLAATLDGELVGASNAFNLWVHPSFRKGTPSLAVEILVERIRYVGPDSRFAKPVKPMRYTHAGFGALKESYRELVKRGLIDPGPDGVPT